MAGETRKVIVPGNVSIIIRKWKVKEGSRVCRGTVLALYEDDGESASPEVHKLKSSSNGIVGRIEVAEGVPAEAGAVLTCLHPMTVTTCRHATVMKDMCADCGADLRMEMGVPGDRKESVTASVAMIHSIPELIVSEEQALEIGRLDEEFLLRTRKLVLLVDLDQTLIHTTNDNVPPNLKDVFHFQMRDGPHLKWYHTRFRPYTQRFLESVTQLYQLHICTFGVRMYAHTIARLLDPDGKFFSHRILSRDECFDPMSKTANLKALFPRGDAMVCIIDDREDVWNFAPNLVHVKPYRFFQGTADINAPPGLTKTENDAVPIIHNVRHCSHSDQGNQHVEGRNKEEGKVPTWEGGTSEGTEAQEGTQASTGQPLTDQPATDQPLTDQPATNQPSTDQPLSDQPATDQPATDQPAIDQPATDQPATDQSSLDETATDQPVTEQSATDQPSTDLPSIDQPSTDLPSIDQPSTDLPSIDQPATDQPSIDETATDQPVTEQSATGQPSTDLPSIDQPVTDLPSSEQRCSNEPEPSEGEHPTEKPEVSNGDEGGLSGLEHDGNTMEVDGDSSSAAQGTPDSSSTNSQGSTEVDSKDPADKAESKAGRKEGEEKDEYSPTPKPPDPQKPGPKGDVAEGEVEWDDDDDYLLHLEEILTRIHTAFYDLYDQSTATATPPSSMLSLKTITPYVKRKVLKDVRLVLSGVVPMNQAVERSRAWTVARSLGAVVQPALVADGSHPTTHLVAARPGTAKVHTARRMRRIKVVRPEWLWACNERWERVPEDLFRLEDLGSGGSDQGASRRFKRPPSQDEVFESQGTEAKRPRTGYSAPGSSRGEGGGAWGQEGEEETPQETGSRTRFQDTINPLYSFSDEELECINKEVDEMMEEEASSSSEEDDERDARFRAQVLSSPSEGSSTEESLSGEMPRGWKRQVSKDDRERRERKERVSKSKGENSDSEALPTEEDTENELDRYEKNMAAFADDSSASNEDSIGSVDDEIADAVEKEFLS